MGRYLVLAFLAYFCPLAAAQSQFPERSSGWTDKASVTAKR